MRTCGLKLNGIDYKLKTGDKLEVVLGSGDDCLVYFYADDWEPIELSLNGRMQMYFRGATDCPEDILDLISMMTGMSLRPIESKTKPRDAYELYAQ